jgi:cytochrome c biogenesis protein CcmG/thiol:disulfide interchange protein DsbE
MTRLRRWMLLTGVVVGVAAVTLLLGVGLRSGTSEAASPLQGRAAPDFSLPGLDGGRNSAVRLSSLRGQVVVVNFWASWCTECQTEQAALNQTWQRFRNAGVVVVGVNFQDAAGDARDYAASVGASYPLVVDRSSRTALDYGLRGIPETFVVDRHGALVHRLIGPVTANRLAGLISPLLDGSGR